MTLFVVAWKLRFHECGGKKILIKSRIGYWRRMCFGFRKKRKRCQSEGCRSGTTARRRLRLHVESDRKINPPARRRPTTRHLHSLLQFLIQQVDRCCMLLPRPPPVVSPPRASASPLACKQARHGQPTGHRGPDWKARAGHGSNYNREETRRPPHASCRARRRGRRFDGRADLA